MSNKLELFCYDSCPFCQMVIQVVNSLNLKVELMNIQNDNSAFERLTKDTGRRTVPCLYIDNKPMFESSDIISWLQENSEKLAKNS